MMDEEEEQAARIFLAGYIARNKAGLPMRRYLPPGEAELEGRRALTALLRGQAPLSYELRTILADLFDPDPGPEGHYANARWLRPLFRAEGVQPNHWGNSAIAKHVFDAVQAGGSAAEGVSMTAQRFGLDERAVWRTWARYRKFVE